MTTGSIRSVLIWAGFLAALVLPLALAVTSPLLAWRQPVYIVAGFAGIVAMGLLLVQPVLAAGMLPGVSVLQGRRVHKWTGSALVVAVLLHIGGLWITSPPDVIDVLLFRSPTPFAVWGVLAMWALFATALLALRKRYIRPRPWRMAHGTLAGVIIIGSVLHAVLIEGTMETVSKIALCGLISIVTLRVLSRLKLRPQRGN